MSALWVLRATLDTTLCFKIYIRSWELKSHRICVKATWNLWDGLELLEVPHHKTPSSKKKCIYFFIYFICTLLSLNKYLQNRQQDVQIVRYWILWKVVCSRS